jgi:hypothetical protein
MNADIDWLFSVAASFTRACRSFGNRADTMLEALVDDPHVRVGLSIGILRTRRVEHAAYNEAVVAERSFSELGDVVGHA